MAAAALLVLACVILAMGNAFGRGMLHGDVAVAVNQTLHRATRSFRPACATLLPERHAARTRVRVRQHGAPCGLHLANCPPCVPAPHAQRCLRTLQPGAGRRKHHGQKGARDVPGPCPDKPAVGVRPGHCRYGPPLQERPFNRATVSAAVRASVSCTSPPQREAERQETERVCVGVWVWVCGCVWGGDTQTHPAPDAGARDDDDNHCHPHPRVV